MSGINLNELKVPLDRVYLVAYTTGSGNEVEFEKDPAATQYFLVLGGPPPIKLAKPELGVTVYRVPLDQEDPIAFCRANQGYCCRGKETSYVLKRLSK